MGGETKRTTEDVDVLYQEAKKLISEGKTISEALRITRLASNIFYARRKRDVGVAYQEPQQRKTKVI